MWAVSADIAPLRCEKNTPQNEIWQYAVRRVYPETAGNF